MLTRVVCLIQLTIAAAATIEFDVQTATGLIRSVEAEPVIPTTTFVQTSLLGVL